MEIIMPKMGESVSEGTIVKWHKHQGDTIRKDEILFEIVTDKVDTEIPAPADGIIEKILVGEGETVPVGSVVAILDSNSPVNISPKESKRRFYSPLVLSIAKRESISSDELLKIKGTGTGGRVTKKDILKYIEKKKKESVPSRQISREKIQKIPLDYKRKQLIANLRHSLENSVHVASLIEVDMSRVTGLKEKLKDNFQREGVKLTYMPFFIEACTKALKDFPLLNSSVTEEEIIVKNYINIGIAVAVSENELVVPNIKNVETMNLLGIARELEEIADRARRKELTPVDTSNGTFSITNYGRFGTIFGTPIIKQPEVAILGIGAIKKQAVVIESEMGDSISIRPTVLLTLSYDHRIIDGMLGSLFLSRVKKYLEG